jgi:hypothetical protein
MKPYCMQNDGGCETFPLMSYGRDCMNVKVVTVPTPPEARALLDRTFNTLGWNAHGHRARCSKHDKSGAVSRVQFGESPEVVANDFAG